MRVSQIALILLLAGSITASAQEMKSGWFGGIGAGIGAHDNDAFSDRLQSWSPLGEKSRELVYRTDRFSNTGYTFNTGAALLLGRHYMVGASAELLMFPTVYAITSTEDRSEYSLSGGGGGLDLGYAVVNSDATIIWPYLHVGYYGYSLDFLNNQTDSIPFFEGTPIAPGGQATYTGASPRIGLGVGLTRYLGGAEGKSSMNGPVLAVKLGYGRFVSHPEWEQNGTTVTNGGHTPCYHALMLTLMIGGGGASF